MKIVYFWIDMLISRLTTETRGCFYEIELEDGRLISTPLIVSKYSKCFQAKPVEALVVLFVPA